jgi:hypothetical protein
MIRKIRTVIPHKGNALAGPRGPPAEETVLDPHGGGVFWSVVGVGVVLLDCTTSRSSRLGGCRGLESVSEKIDRPGTADGWGALAKNLILSCLLGLCSGLGSANAVG